MKRKNLIKLRVDLGLKSVEMAEKLGITRTKYSNIENGRVNPSYGFMQKFEETFKEQCEDVWELFKQAE